MRRHIGLGLGLLAAGAVLLPGAAGAAPLLARYEVQAAGLRVAQVEALLDLEGPRYRIRTRIRMTGMAGWFSSGDQLTSAEGGWRGPDPVPAQYQTEGLWRGSYRRVVIDYSPAGMPRLRAIEPPNRGEREPVPEALQQGTIDALSALAKLTRSVAETGRCDGTAAVFDGRRRADYSVRTVAMAAPAGGPAGPLLHCAFESRTIAGFRSDQDPEEARRPHPADAWFGWPLPGGGPLPVRIDLAHRWFGSMRAVLVGVEAAGPAERSAPAGAQQPR